MNTVLPVAQKNFMEIGKNNAVTSIQLSVATAYRKSSFFLRTLRLWCC